MNKIKWLSLSLVAVFLYGCASGAKVENMTYTEQGLTYDPALHQQVGVTNVTGGQETNPLWTSEISDDAFRNALQNSLESQGLLSDSGRYKLTVILAEVDQPIMGLDLEVITQVNYRLVDTKTGKAVMDELIVAPYTATISDAFAAIKRLRLANEGSGRSNIEHFLKKLSTLKISSGEISLAQ